MVVGKDKPPFHASHHVNAITFLLIGIIIATTISFVFPIVLNQNHTAMAQQQQQQMQANQTFSPSVEEQQQLLEGLSFQIDIVTRMARDMVCMASCYASLSSELYCYCT